MKCECCSKEHDKSYGSGRFCDSRCARAFSTKQKRKEINAKVSQKLSGRKGHKQTYKSLQKRKETLQSKYGTTNSFDLCDDIHRKKQHLLGCAKYTEKYNKILDSLPFNELPKRQKFKRIRRIGVCMECGINEWNGKPPPLQIDHIDGNNQNNDESNLRLLCANCHAQTSTFAGRNKRDKCVYKVTDEELIDSLKKSKSLYSALRSVGLHGTGASYSRVLRLLDTMQI
jgi:hypothetical protein